MPAVDHLYAGRIPKMTILEENRFNMSSEKVRQTWLDKDASVALQLREALSERLNADELDMMEKVIKQRCLLAVDIYRLDRYLNDGRGLRS
jgi:hypothetical protein